MTKLSDILSKVRVIISRYLILHKLFRQVEARGQEGHCPPYEFLYEKDPSCLKLVGKFFVSVYFESTGLMKIL